MLQINISFGMFHMFGPAKTTSYLSHLCAVQLQNYCKLMNYFILSTRDTISI